MPGFVIGGSPGQASTLPSGGNLDWFREHRYRLLQLLSVKEIDVRKNGELLALKEVQLPTKSISEIAIKTPATTYKFANNASYTDLSLTFYGSRKMLEIILALQDTAHNIRSGVGDFHHYKDIVEFLIYDRYAGDSIGVDENNTIKYQFRNAWISDVDHGSLSYSSSEIKSITCTVKFDYYDVYFDGTKVEGVLTGSQRQQLRTGIEEKGL